MKPKKKIIPESNPDPADVVETIYCNNVASARECTGLHPTPPDSVYERQSYEDVYPFLPPRPQKSPSPEPPII